MARSIFKKTVAKWGVSAQVCTAMEECGELVSALNKFFFRHRIDKIELASEVADVEIVCEQIRSLIGDDIVDVEKKKKMDRLIQRVNHGL